MNSKKTPLDPANLLINEDGSIYHLHLRPEDLADTVLIAGEPERAEAMAEFFDEIEVSRKNREFYSFTGNYHGKRITALSTGIGTDNIDIVVNELDALANIDFKTRTINVQHRTLRIIRIGTSGSVHPDVPAGAVVLSSFGLGIDGTTQYYTGLEHIDVKEMTEAFIYELQWPDHLPRPYFIPGNPELINTLKDAPYHGITVTAPGFYASQGRKLRLSCSFPGLLQKIAAFEYQGHKVMNFEMETAALFALTKLLGHKAASICIILANRALGTYEPKHKESIKDMIAYVLERI